MRSLPLSLAAGSCLATGLFAWWAATLPAGSGGGLRTQAFDRDEWLARAPISAPFVPDDGPGLAAFASARRAAGTSGVAGRGAGTASPRRGGEPEYGPTAGRPAGSADASAGGSTGAVAQDDDRAADGRELFVRTYPDGQRRIEGELRDGRREGVWTEWWESGQVQSEGEYVYDDRVGEWTFWHENGERKREGLYVDGQMEGLWTEWHPSGERQREGRLVRGTREDVWHEWYSNGQIRETGRYDRGRREGYWKFFDFHGRIDLRRTGFYENGRRVR